MCVCGLVYSPWMPWGWFCDRKLIKFTERIQVCGQFILFFELSSCVCLAPCLSAVKLLQILVYSPCHHVLSVLRNTPIIVWTCFALMHFHCLFFKYFFQWWSQRSFYTDMHLLNEQMYIWRTKLKEAKKAIKTKAAL